MSSLLWRVTAIRGWAGARIIAEMSAALGADVAFEQLDVQPGLPPRIILEGLSVTREGRTILRAERLVAEPRLRALARGELDLASLVVERARLDVTAGDLAEAASRRPSGGRTPARIGDLRLRESSLSFRDAASGFELDIPVLSARSPGFFDGSQLIVHVEGEAGRLVMGATVVQPVDFSAQVRRDDAGLRIDDLRARSPGLDVLVSATATLEGERPALDAQVELECVTGTLVALGLLPAGVPAGVVSWDGRLLAMPRGWSAWGKLRSESLELRQDLQPTPAFSDISANVTLSTAAVEISQLRARLGRGVVEADLRATRGNEGWLLAGAARVEELPLREIPLPRALSARRPALEGSLGLDVDGTLPLADPSRARVSWTLGVSRAAREGEGIPIAGEGHGSLRDARAQIERLDLSIAGAGVSIEDGSLGLDGSLDLDALMDAPSLGVTLAGLRPTVAALADIPRDLGGALAATASITGSVDAPVAALSLTGQDLVLGEWPLGRLEGALAWRASALTANARLEGEALTLRLDEISHAAGGAWTGRWEIERADASVVGELAAIEGLAGTFGGAGSFVAGGAGGQTEPALAPPGGLVAAGTLEGEDLTIKGQKLDRVLVEARAGRRGLAISRLEFARGDSRALGSGRLPWSSATSAEEGGESGDARLEWHDWPLELPFAGSPLTASVSGSAALRGSVTKPRLAGEVALQAADLRWRGFAVAALDGLIEETDAGISLTLGDNESGALVRAFLGTGDDRRLRALGSLGHLLLPLPAGTSDRDLSVELHDIDLVVDGSLEDLPNLEIMAEAQRFGLHGKGIDAPGLTPLRIEGPASRLELAPATIAVFGQPFAIGGSASIVGAVSWDLDAEGDVPLAAFEAHLPGARLGGHAAITLHVAAGEGTSSIAGGATIRDGYLNHPTSRQTLRALEAEIALEDDVLTLVRAEGIVGGGSVTGRGSARLVGWVPSDYDVQLRGDNVALRFGEHFRGVADFRLEAESRGDDLMLRGDAQLLRARLTTPADLGGTGRLSQMRPPGLLDSVLLDLRVRAPEQLVIDNAAILAEFEADLDIVGTGARPIVLGSLDLVRQGKVFYRGTEFVLSDASLQLTRAFPGDPEVDAHASARLGFHDVEMSLSDRVSQLNIQLTSVPELPEESLVAMLATGGRLSTGLAEEGAALPAPFARRSSGVDSSLSAKGVDPIRLDPVFVEGSVLPSARLTLGQQLTPKLFAGYSLSLRGDQEGTMELRYRVKPRFELRLAYEEGGSNVGEIRWTRSFRSPKARESIAQSKQSEEDEAAPFVRVVSMPGLHGSRIDPDLAMAALALAPGAKSTKSARLRAAGRLRDFVVESGHPLARVSCIDVGVVEDGEVDVSCGADLGPRVNLILEGLAPDEEKVVRDAVLQSWGELAFRDELVTTAAFAAQEAILARGQARVTARASAEDRGDEMDVRVSLTPGDVIRVGSVEIAGVEALSEKKLRRELVSTHRQGWKRPKLTPDLAAVDRDTLLGAYQAAGFVDASVTLPVVTYPVNEPLASLEFRVEEGERRRLVGVIFTGDAPLSDEERAERAEIEKALPLGVGDIADPDVLDEYARTVASRLDAKGFPDAALSWRLRPATDGRILEFVLIKGPRVSVGEIRVEGLVNARESTLRREIRLEGGAPFRRGDLGEVRQRLAGLGLFQSIIVRGEPRPDDPGVRDVLVRVVEKPLLDMSVGFGIEDSSPRGSFSIGQRNIAGTGASVGLQLHAAGGDRLIRVLSGLHHVRGTRNDVLLVAGFERDDRPGFTSDTTFVGVQMSRQLGRNVTLLPRLRWEDVELPRLDVSPSEARLSEGKISGPGVGILWDGRDDPFWPTKGSVASLDLSFSAELFGADHSFTKAFAQYSIAHSLRKDSLIIAGSVRAGVGWSFDDSDKLPLSERFFAGGVGSVRGWELDNLGPKDAVTNEPVGGDAVLVLNTELRARLSRRAWFIGFIDAGNVFENPSEVGSPRLELTFGPGLGLATPIGPLRFYYGHKVEDPPDEPSGEFHFTFGSTF